MYLASVNEYQWRPLLSGNSLLPSLPTLPPPPRLPFPALPSCGSFTAGGSKKIDVSFIVDTLQTVGSNLKSAMYASQVESDVWMELLYAAPGRADYRSYPTATECVRCFVFVFVCVGGGGGWGISLV
jgi:hypothetical protein